MTARAVTREKMLEHFLDMNWSVGHNPIEMCETCDAIRKLIDKHGPGEREVTKSPSCLEEPDTDGGALRGGNPLLGSMEAQAPSPGHLFLGSQSENTIDMVKKGRCYNRKVTDEMVRYIRESPQSSSIIGKKLGLHAGHIRKIRLGKAAGHVE